MNDRHASHSNREVTKNPRFPRLPEDLPRLGTRRTAQRLFGMSQYRLTRWVADGRLRAYVVEGVATPRYDLNQIADLLRLEGPDGSRPGRRRRARPPDEHLTLDQVLDEFPELEERDLRDAVRRGELEPARLACFKVSQVEALVERLRREGALTKLYRAA